MQFIFGKQTIHYNIQRHAKPVLKITVLPGGVVFVVVPADKTDAEIAQRVKRKAKWIVRQLNYFEQCPPSQPLRSFVNGETHHYLGKQYRLKINCSDTTSTKCVLKSGYFCITVADISDKKQIQTLLENWYRETAKRYFQQRLEYCVAKMKRYKIAMPKLLIRKMLRRWGSCTKKCRILLNLDLVKMPPQCIDYVIVHELCHLLERNHTDKFYRLLSSILPEWKKAKEKLDMLS